MRVNLLASHNEFVNDYFFMTKLFFIIATVLSLRVNQPVYALMILLQNTFHRRVPKQPLINMFVFLTAY